MKRTNLSGIFAAVFVAATVITLASCSQDDEYYEDGLFTRADEMMTRSGEQGGYTPTQPTQNTVPIYSDTVYANYKFSFHADEDGWPTDLTSNIDVCMYRKEGRLCVEMLGFSLLDYSPNSLSDSGNENTSVLTFPNGYIEETFRVESVGFEIAKTSPLMYRMWAYANIADTTAVTHGLRGVVTNYLFH